MPCVLQRKRDVHKVQYLNQTFHLYSIFLFIHFNSTYSLIKITLNINLVNVIIYFM